MGDNFQCGMCVFLLKEIENLKKELYQHSIQPSCLDQLVEKFSDSCGTQTIDSISSSEIHCQTETNSRAGLNEVTSCAKPMVDFGCGTDDHPKMLVKDNGMDVLIKPYCKLDKGLFKSVDIVKLDSQTHYSHEFNSRSVAYYSELPYVYNGGMHSPCPVSENSYLEQILKHVHKEFPSLTFNSAMITRYNDGSQGIPYHSDNEECIQIGSMICSISLGETRSLQFRSKNRSIDFDSMVSLGHGDFLFMSQKSQKYFEHSIPKDFSNNMRISITLREINCDSHQHRALL
ncbi:MAG: alpha-ketoglutarate-dependent dioxygenase AlkB, partial [Cytophagales bacterium]|nr:alpha-ketoglutarate-dependent dioxygenase AlkB [Cytophagales bacterium]